VSGWTDPLSPSSSLIRIVDHIVPMAVVQTMASNTYSLATENSNSIVEVGASYNGLEQTVVDIKHRCQRY